MAATYEYAEPGVIFIDRINAMNNLAYCEDHRGDEPLWRAAPATLRRLSLGLDQPCAAWSRTPLKRTASMSDEVALGELVDNGRQDDGQRGRCLALPAWRRRRMRPQAKRRIGLGVTGLADALMMVGAALWVGRGGAPDRGAGWKRSRAPPTARRRIWPGREGRLPAVRGRGLPGERVACKTWTRKPRGH